MPEINSPHDTPDRIYPVKCGLNMRLFTWIAVLLGFSVSVIGVTMADDRHFYPYVLIVLGLAIVFAVIYLEAKTDEQSAVIDRLLNEKEEKPVVFELSALHLADDLSQPMESDEPDLGGCPVCGDSLAWRAAPVTVGSDGKSVHRKCKELYDQETAAKAMHPAFQPKVYDPDGEEADRRADKEDDRNFNRETPYEGGLCPCSLYPQPHYLSKHK